MLRRQALHAQHDLCLALRRTFCGLDASVGVDPETGAVLDHARGIVYEADQRAVDVSEVGTVVGELRAGVHPVIRDGLVAVDEQRRARTRLTRVARAPAHLDRDTVAVNGVRIEMKCGTPRRAVTVESDQDAGQVELEGGRIQLPVGGRSVEVNRYVIEKGLDRQVVLYWYQGRGRIVASEYANKFWLMVDAARVHRTNGALVRVMAPIGSNAANLGSADRAVIDFSRALLSQLNGFLP